MKLTFVSNYINHHQMPLCDALYERLGDDFRFVQTMPMEEERKAMGWEDLTSRPYVELLYEDEFLCRKLIQECDLALFGWTEREDIVQERLDAGKASIRVSERLYREGRYKAISPRGLIAKYKEHIRYRNSNVCMLCSGAYTAADFALIGAYPGKMFRWGYFPPFREQNRNELEEKKNSESGIQIAWAGRFIPLKHPEYPVKLATKLASMGYDFVIHMLGGGAMEDELKEMVKAAGLTEHFVFYGFVAPEQVRDVMERCKIHLFTSNYLEGWGAVVNEGMNSGCVEIVNAQVGAAPFLIRDGINGLVYPDDRYDRMEELVLRVCSDPEQYAQLGRAAYETIRDEWNAKEAARRLIIFGEKLLQGKIEGEQGGPLSPAPVITPGKMYRAIKDGRI